jgi:periplasmic protein TonB
MNSRSILIGACALKRPYQTNLAIGFGISVLMHLALVVTVFLLASYQPEKVIPIKITMQSYGLGIIPPVVKEPAPPKPTDPDHPTKAPNFGIPTRIADSLIQDPADIPTLRDIDRYIPSTPVTDLSNNIIIDTDKVAETLLPSRGTISFYDEPPLAVNSVKPEYPDLARRTGLQGKVWLEVLIDKDGSVRDVSVVKCDNKDMGFEDAAMAAAWKSVWKPAISNGLPIAVRVTYSVVFKLQ